MVPNEKRFYVSNKRGDEKGRVTKLPASYRVKMKVFAYGVLKPMFLVCLKHTFFFLLPLPFSGVRRIYFSRGRKLF